MIAWVRKGVCGWDSLDCCLKVHVCVCRGREGGKKGRGGVCVCGTVGVGVIVWVGLGVIAWVRKGVCGWDSLDCYLKVCTCMCVLGGKRGRGSVVVGVWV